MSKRINELAFKYNIDARTDNLSLFVSEIYSDGFTAGKQVQQAFNTKIALRDYFAWAEVEHAKELLAQPEQETETKQENTQYLLDQVSRLTAENAMLKEKVFERPELSINSLQLYEPVAWITEWVQRYRHNDTPIMDRAVSFTKGGAPAVPNPNYIPLYTAPPKREGLEEYKKGYAKAELDLKREPMTGSEISHGFRADKDAINSESYYAGVELAEKHYGVEINETL